MKQVAVLGSTGSIGAQALDVIARHPSHFQVVGLAAGTRTQLLLEQARVFRPSVVSCARDQDAADLRAAVPAGVRVGCGASGLTDVAAKSGADIVVAATDGAVAFEAVFAAVERGIWVAVANKELIVAAGELLFEAARASGARLLPVDSEHSALFQCLVGEPPERVAMLVLTASGGPFWTFDAARMREVSLADALRHPTWQMGTKNTVDSATMMNKGLEVIEASRFFGLAGDRIGVLVHRSSVAHGFAIFTDGSIKAQLAVPDMRVPIGYALAYPDRLCDVAVRDPMSALGAGAASSLTLTFERPDFERFPCLGLAYEALRRGGTAPAVLSAANEVAVDAFVRGRIAFCAIAEVVGATLAATAGGPLTLLGVRAADAQARVAAEQAVVQRSGGARAVNR